MNPKATSMAYVRTTTSSSPITLMGWIASDFEMNMATKFLVTNLVEIQMMGVWKMICIDY